MASLTEIRRSYEKRNAPLLAEAPPKAPVIATSSIYSDYLRAIRTNMDALLRLTQALHDKEAETEAQRILDCHDDAAIDLLALIGEAECNVARDEWWEKAW